MEGFRAVRTPVHDQVRDHLLREIREGRYAPGDSLPPERELAIQLGVSRHSLRQAMSSLETLGLVVVRQGSGVVLAGQPTGEALDRVAEILFAANRSIEDVIVARALLEPGIAALAATHASAAAAAALVADAHDLGEPTDPSSMDSLGNAFHLQVAQLSGNPVLEGLLRALVSGPRYTDQLAGVAAGRAPGAWQQAHQEIAAAIAERDVQGAEDLMAAHLRGVLALARTPRTPPGDAP